MEVKFYYNQSDDRVINKTLIEGESFEGQARDSISIMTPSVIFDKQGIIRYNYAYIPEFERYYKILDKIAYREGLWIVNFEVDVLMSFRNDIMHMKAIVDKQTMEVCGNEYIDDSSLVSENIMFKQVYNFLAGFNDTSEYILITAG